MGIRKAHPLKTHGPTHVLMLGLGLQNRFQWSLTLTLRAVLPPGHWPLISGPGQQDHWQRSLIHFQTKCYSLHLGDGLLPCNARVQGVWFILWAWCHYLWFGLQGGENLVHKSSRLPGISLRLNPEPEVSQSVALEARGWQGRRPGPPPTRGRGALNPAIPPQNCYASLASRMSGPYRKPSTDNYLLLLMSLRGWIRLYRLTYDNNVF